MKTLQRIALAVLVVTLLIMPAQGQEALWKDLYSKVMSLYKKGRYPEASKVAEEALTVAERTFGSNHPNVATSLNNLALLYEVQGRYAEAEPLYKRSLKILKDLLPRIAYQLGYIRVRIANLDKYIWNMEQIELQLSQGKDMYPPVLGIEAFKNQFSSLARSVDVEVHYIQVKTKPHKFYTEAMLSMTLVGNAQAVIALIEKQSAEPRLTTVNRLFRQAENKFHLDLIIFSFKYSNAKKKHKEINIESKLCPEFESQIWPWPFEGRITRMWQEFETLCAELREHTEKRRLIEEMDGKVKYTRAFLAEVKKLVKRGEAQNLKYLADLCKDVGDYAKAEPLYKSLLAITEKDLGKDHPEVATVLENMAKCYREMGNEEEAEKLQTRAKKIRSNR